MLLFLDTEYTGSSEWTHEPKLMSLALVTEDGHREFYVELADTWQIDECSEFVRREVIPLLDGPLRSIAEARDELRAWFAHAPRETQAACDSSIDFRFLLGLLGEPLPVNLSRAYYDLRPLIDTSVYDRAVSRAYECAGRLHHALADARAYRRGWLAWMASKASV
jgi:hypothetical protein